MSEKLHGREVENLIAECCYQEALFLCRADITQYTIWHKRHTEQMVVREVDGACKLLHIDVNAMAELVEKLMFCYRMLRIEDKLPCVIECLRGNIKDTSWQRKVQYYQALCTASISKWNKRAVQKELAKLGSIEDENDSAILQLYLEAYSEVLSFSEKMKIVDRIICRSRRPAEVFHYKGTKAYLYFLIGDNDAAEVLLDEAIRVFRKEMEGLELGVYEMSRLAMALDFLGTIRNDHQLIVEGIELYNKTLQAPGWTKKGEAEMHKSVADSYRKIENWQLALESYTSSLAIDGSEQINSVFIAECMLRMGRVEEAKELIQSLIKVEFECGEKIDFGFVYAAVAIEAKSKEMLAVSKRLLEELQFKDPYFSGRRDALLISVFGAREESYSKDDSGKIRSFLNKFRKVTSYLILKPNFMGLGVDINKIVNNDSDTK